MSKDRSNTPKGCNAMYVEDGKRTYTNIFAHNSTDFQSIKSFEKLRLRAFQPYHQILCILKHIKDRSNTPKGCNAMYVKDGKRTYTQHFCSTPSSTYILLHSIQCIEICIVYLQHLQHCFDLLYNISHMHSMLCISTPPTLNNVY